MNGLEIRFLGDFVVKQGGEIVTTLNKPRLQSLLAYLILHRDAPQFRYHLAGILWPDSPEDQAHTNLRNLVHLLRKALPDGNSLIYADNQTLRWNPEAECKLDILDFQQVASQDSIQNLSLEALETAAKVYHGDLLPSCYDEWVSVERDHYHQVFIAVLDQLIDRYESLRRYADAIACCQRLVTVEPFDKDGYPRLMRLLVLHGEVPPALKTYQEYARLLKHELGIEPPADMQDLYAHIRKVQPSAGYQASASAPLPLVGRAAEWQAIQSIWKTAAGGNPRMLVIYGEAGIGKTRLAEELVDWAASQGIRTAAAHCYASEGALPYAPVVEWLRAAPPPHLDKVWLRELARLLPELLKETSSPPPLSEAWQRLRLFEALARATLGDRRKTLLLIEDLHWCDQDTLEWLHYLLRFDPHASLLVVGTLRSEETTASPACGQLLSGLRQQDSLLEMELGPLSETETGQLAAHVAGKNLEHGIGSLIYQETEGNPLFIVETVRTELFKQGRLPGVQPLAYKANAVLENRIRQLSQACRAIVLLAATIGRAFPLEVLRQASGSGEAELIASLDEMLQRRIVREVAQNTFDFSHDKLRQAALVGLSSAHHQLLHHQVADALVGVAKNDIESRSGEIATHYDQAGCLELAVQYYQMAARSARKIFANDLAIQYYQRAISLGEIPLSNPSVQAIPPDQLAQLYEELGDMLALVGKYPQAQAAFEYALAQPFPFPGLWGAQIHRKISETLMQQYQHPPAHAALDQAEKVLNLPDEAGTRPERQEWIQIQLARSNLFYWGNHPDQMDAILQKILPMIEAEGRPDQHVELLDQQMMSRLRHERYRLSDETVEIARRKLELVNTLGVLYDISWAQFHVGFSLLWHGEPQQAREWMVKAYEAAVRMGARLLQVRSLAYLSVASRQLKDVPTLREQSSHLYELASAIGEYAYQGISLANQGWLAWRDGDLLRAEQLCNSANETWKQSGGNMFPWLADWVLLAIAVSRGDLDRAEKRAQALLNPNPLIQPAREPIAVRLEEALCACRTQEDPEAAFQCFKQTLEMVKASGDL
jgi:DNA-binding SARP family transcriptional activator